jgi:hypothetical protein
MTVRRLFPSVNGPAAAQSYSGNFISGVVFAVSGGSQWFEGYWWWVSASVQSTAPVKCALWCSGTGTGAGTLVPGSAVTSGTLTAGQWNYIPLPAPVQLAPGYDANLSTSGSAYVAAIGCNGPFPDTNNFWGSSGPGTNGIINGPLVAYSGSTGGGTLAAPYGLAQGVFTTGESDPAAAMPAGGSNTDNFWVDVQVSDTAPAGYAGSYRLWPNKYDANSATTTDAAVNYTIATEISLNQECVLGNTWYYSLHSAATLATRCDVWSISTGTPAASITSPAWLTAAGASYAPGDTPAGLNGTWIRAAFAGSTVLPVGKYRVSVYNSEGTADASWSPKDAVTDYWGETFPGAGAGGISWGPLTAPGWASSSGGYQYDASAPSASPPYSSGTVLHAQPVFGMLLSGAADFPQLFAPGNTSGKTQNYWVDLEVTPVPAAGMLPGSFP